MRGGSLCISPPRRTSHCPQRRRRCWVHPDMTQVCLIVSSLFSDLATSHLGGVDPGRDLEGRLLHQGGQDEREDHGQAHEEGGEDDLAHEPLLVPLGVVEPLDGERHDVFQHQLRPFNRGCYACTIFCPCFKHSPSTLVTGLLGLLPLVSTVSSMSCTGTSESGRPTIRLGNRK